jgi:hypothetical protein
MPINSKIQAPSSQEGSSSNLKERGASGMEFEIWKFFGIWNLELGTLTYA